MVSNVATHTAQRAVTITRRFFVRRDPPVWPFVWRGLLPALGLVALAWFALSPFARDGVEAEVRQRTRADLDAAGLQWADVEVSGQNVVLSGRPPQAGAGERAVQLAWASNCPTWAGPKPCAVDVQGRFVAIAAPPSPPSAPLPSSSPLTAPAKAEAAPTPAARVAAQACEQALAGLLSGTRILFASGRAQLRRDSDALLDKLAAAARGCPGKVRIEGHTDKLGTEPLNQALSTARASAVRDALIARGLAPERLIAEGFGTTKPRADNTSAHGRAANRRIELRPAD